MDMRVFPDLSLGFMGLKWWHPGTVRFNYTSLGHKVNIQVSLGICMGLVLGPPSTLPALLHHLWI